MRLTMVGTGYVGLVTGTCFANTGNSVTCLDVDEGKISRLRRGECPIYEPGLGELIHKNVEARRLFFTTDRDEAYRDAEVIFICVGTPTGANGDTDLGYIQAAADDIAEVMHALGPSQSPKTVVVKSTVPVGTTHMVRDRIRRRVGPNIPFRVANNPEFLKEGDAVSDFNRPDRVVVGVEDDQAGEVFRDLYDPFVRNGHPIFVMDILSSEMVKYASNNFLATKISFINEMANLCEALGANVNRVREGMCSDRRIGHQFLYPGLGYGGSCFPKDTRAIIMMGERTGTPIELSRAVDSTNMRQRARFFGKIERHFAPHGGLSGKRLAFWGLAFKPRTDDVREAPALSLVRMTTDAGATAIGFDPVAGSTAKAAMQDRLEIAADMYDALTGADALVVSTDWDDFKSPDFRRIGGLMRSRVIFDGRNLYRRQHLGDLGFHYYSVGRAPVVPRDA
ncbi:MAG: UDP-glucose/GDP-mannose dehydrogenase family protein [Leptolyngbya sp. PLA3]|nr:MAG: UDP-glucose/GDP-mannose dehydrogenase family protein [Cyanobacteria bacterium CYA]MCE7968842.1 UDP-glucose/GDP-mannose dehydrogenase family protein [Leptolyngbya sp. PL-A3]